MTKQTELTVEQMADEIVAQLMTNGIGSKATRLLLVKDPPDGCYVKLTEPHRDLGGLCEGAIRDLLIEFAREIKRDDKTD